MHTTHRRRAPAPPESKKEGGGVPPGPSAIILYQPWGAPGHRETLPRTHHQHHCPTPTQEPACPPTSLPPAECLQPSPHTLVKRQVWGSSQAPPGTPIPASRPLIKLSSSLPTAPDVASPALHCNPITCLLQSLQEPLESAAHKPKSLICY